jgi:hypothetical protein
MRVRLMGANPFLTLFEDDAPVAFVSGWRVDWSEQGKGRALVFGDENGIRVIATDGDLGGWLVNTFNRYLTAGAGLPWTPLDIRVAPVEFEFDLDHGHIRYYGDHKPSTIGLLGASESLPFPIVIFVIGALLLWLSIHAKGQGWLKDTGSGA